MLSERERHQLEIIERDLRSSDPELSALLRRSLGRGVRRHVLYSRCLVVFGALLMVAGVVLSMDQTFVQGLLLATAGGMWWGCRISKGPTRPSPSPRTTHRR